MLKRIVKNLDGYQRGHAWLAFPLAVVKKFAEDQAPTLAALIAYFTFFSLFPLLLALVTILGYVLHGDPAMQQRFVSSALAQFPVIGDQIRSNIGSLKGSGPALMVGAGGVLWAGMAAVNATQKAMNAVWDVPIRDKPTFLKRRLRSLLMLVVIGGGLFATVAASAVASSADSIAVVGRLAAPVASVLVGIAVFTIAFRVLTEGDFGWSDVFPGAVVAAVAAVAFQLIGAFYLGHSLRAASRTYGTFAIVFGLLSWLYLQALVILLAAEVNVVRARRLWPRSLRQDADHLTDADRDAFAQHADVEIRIPDQDVRTTLP